MITIDEFAPRTFQIACTGKINEGDIVKLEAVFGPFVADEGSVDALIDMAAMDATTLGGILEDADLEPRLMRQVEKFGRVALVTTSGRLDTIVAAFEQVLPKGEFRRYAPEQLDAARAYVTS